MRLELYIVVVGLAFVISLIVETLSAYRLILCWKGGLPLDLRIELSAGGLKKALYAAIAYILSVMSLVMRLMSDASPGRAIGVTSIVAFIGLAVAWLIGYIAVRALIRNTQRLSS